MDYQISSGVNVFTGDAKKIILRNSPTNGVGDTAGDDLVDGGQDTKHEVLASYSYKAEQWMEWESDKIWCIFVKYGMI